MKKALKSYRTKLTMAQTLKAVLNAKSVEKVRVSDITERCGLYRETLYYHFEDIYALLSWSITHDFEAMLEQLADSALQATALQGPIADMVRYPKYYQQVFQSEVYDRLRQSFRPRFLRALDQYVFFPDTFSSLPEAPSKFARCCSAFIAVTLEQWVRHGCDEPADMINVMITSVLKDARMIVDIVSDPTIDFNYTAISTEPIS